MKPKPTRFLPSVIARMATVVLPFATMWIAPLLIAPSLFHTAALADQPANVQTDQSLTFDQLDPLWQARLEASCGIPYGDQNARQKACLAHALNALNLAVAAFQPPETSRRKTLSEIEQYLGQDGQKYAKTGQTEAARYMKGLIMQLPFHPLCLDRLGLSFGDSPALKDGLLVCNEHFDQPIVVQTYLGGFSYSASRQKTEEGYDLGYMSYAVALVDQSPNGDVFFLSVQDNTGGTGRFASIQVLRQLEPLNVFDPHYSMQGGDRCNDGNLRVLGEANLDQFNYAQSATPYRLLHPGGVAQHISERVADLLHPEQERESQGLLQWAPYSDIKDCALCCVGTIVYTRDMSTDASEAIALTINKGVTIEDFFANEALIECGGKWFDEVVLVQAEKENYPDFLLAVTMGRWQEMLQELESSCEGVAPEAPIQMDRDALLRALEVG